MYLLVVNGTLSSFPYLNSMGLGEGAYGMPPRCSDARRRTTKTRKRLPNLSSPNPAHPLLYYQHLLDPHRHMNLSNPVPARSHQRRIFPFRLPLIECIQQRLHRVCRFRYPLRILRHLSNSLATFPSSSRYAFDLAGT